ncbi:MAG: precorrin-6A reductase [Ruminococcus flavefaciens]|nr:precorrin-6A reductase [Ruminococcus flavefaciens]MCM1059937.1 precorrin-6A reductase [Eubacterium sp.]
MCEIFIFGGTTEGRVIAEWCVNHRIKAFVSVATGYGSKLLPESEYLEILENRLDSEQMMRIFREKDISIVIDATHPYAVEVSRNISTACYECGVEKFRIIRNNSQDFGDAICFDDISGIISYLNQNPGNALITTGSKEISKFCGVDHYQERCIVRILDVPEIVEQCSGMGFHNIIAERGPFSLEKNSQHIIDFSADFVVTKDSGETGGFHEKLMAAKLCGAVPLIIKRPVEEGIMLDKMLEILEEIYNG